jgi:DNA-directed RNA polymerase specialized sigma24 family protein
MTPGRVPVRYVITPAPDQEVLEPIDDLLALALSGDARALSAVVLTFGPVLLGVARRELGLVHACEADDVVQDLYTTMASGALASAGLSLGLGEALPWLKRAVREHAWAHRERSLRGEPGPVRSRRRCRW